MKKRNEQTSYRTDEQDEQSKRSLQQPQDYNGEAQNVNDDEGRPMEPGETDHARNKATEGIRQGRDEDNRNSNS
jgi:hypothetical protein